jgi:hypothetical protein
LTICILTTNIETVKAGNKSALQQMQFDMTTIKLSITLSLAFPLGLVNIAAIVKLALLLYEGTVRLKLSEVNLLVSN